MALSQTVGVGRKRARISTWQVCRMAPRLSTASACLLNPEPETLSLKPLHPTSQDHSVLSPTGSLFAEPTQGSGCRVSSSSFRAYRFGAEPSAPGFGLGFRV